MTAAALQAELQTYADRKRAEAGAWFFKTYEGGYGEGDQFLGLKVPVVRNVAKHFSDLALVEVAKLLASPIHECRQAGLFILVNRAKRADKPLRKELYEFFMQHIRAVNNWDLVDGSAPTLVGEYLLDEPRDILYDLARSNNLWERRIAMLSTQAFIRAGQFDDALALAEILLHDEQDLMHKAVGWMLREVGNREEAQLKQFLDKHAHEMPRTMLRYAIEHLSPEQRKLYLEKKNEVVRSASRRQA